MPARSHPALPALLLAALCADPAAAQVAASSAVAIERALDDLAEPARAHAAADALVAIGDDAVPRLAALLTVPQRYVEPRLRTLGALYVLARLGAAALPALPAIESACSDRDGGIAEQALWTLGEVGPFATPERRAQLQAALRPWPFAARVASVRLQLSAQPAAEQLRADVCAADAARVTAACLAMRVPGCTKAAALADLRGCLRIQLEVALRPLAAPWEQNPLRPAAGALAAAFVGIAGANGVEPRDLLVGRGLLHHQDVALRRRALPLLRDLGALPLHERAELLPLLLDGDAELRQMAAWTFQGLGRRGLLALPLLRRLQTLDSDVGMRMACTTVGDELRAAYPEPAAAALLAAVEQRLGDPALAAPPLPWPTDGDAVAALVEILCGAEWAEKAVVERLLPLPPAGTVVPPELFAAVLRLCINVDPEIRRLAAAWLVRHGPGAVPTDLEATFAAMAATLGFEDVGWHEVLAWLRAGPHVADAELAAAMRHGNVRVAVRAVAAWCVREHPGELLDRDELRRQVAAVDAEPDGARWRLAGLDLARERRTAAALALAAAGDAEARATPAAFAWLAPRDRDGTEWAAAHLAQHGYAALARELEARLVATLEVPDGIAPP